MVISHRTTVKQTASKYTHRIEASASRNFKSANNIPTAQLLLAGVLIILNLTRRLR